jgi:hypothetical protein
MKKATKLRRKDPFGDYDNDGVPNWRDCEPTNPKKHGIPIIVSRYSLNQALKASQKKRPTKQKAELIKIFNNMEADYMFMYGVPRRLVQQYRKRKTEKRRR